MKDSSVKPYLSHRDIEVRASGGLSPVTVRIIPSTTDGQRPCAEIIVFNGALNSCYSYYGDPADIEPTLRRGWLPRGCQVCGGGCPGYLTGETWRAAIDRKTAEPNWLKEEPSDGTDTSRPLPPPSFIVCAAMRNAQGSILCSPRHFDPIARAQIARDSEQSSWKTAQQGFVDQFGSFLTREQALTIARTQDQIRRRCGGDEERLYSENLY